MKLLYLLPTLLLLSVTVHVYAQSNPADTAMKHADLKTVVVCDHANGQEELFNFYRSNRSNTTEEIMARMPGVFLIRRGNYGMEPVMRGFSSAQLNLTLDGMKIAGACTDKMDPVSIYVEPVNLQGLQVSSGASGAKTGATLGGGMNMMLKEAEFLPNRKPFFGFNSAFNTVNTGITKSAFLNLNSDKLAWRISGVYRKAGNYKTAGNTEVLYSGYEKANVSASLVYKLSAKKILKADILDDYGWNIGFPALTMDVGQAHATIGSLTLRYSSPGSFVSGINTKVYYNQVLHAMDDTKRPFVLMHMDMPGISKTAGAYSELDFRVGKKHALSARADAYHSSTLAEMTMYPTNEPEMYLQTLPDNYRINTGLFLLDEISIDSLQKFIVSTRIDRMLTVMQGQSGQYQWSVFGVFPMERVFVIKNFQASYLNVLNKKFSTQLSAGYAERIPSPNEMYGYYLFNRMDNYDYLGNLMLKPEKSLQGEWSLCYTGAKSSITLTTYFHHIKDYILAQTDTLLVAMTPGARGVKVNTNITGATIVGGDLSISQQLSRRFDHISTVKLVIGSTYNHMPLPQIPPLKCVHALRYKKLKWLFQAESEWALPQYRNNVGFGEPQTRSYLIFNIRSGYKFTSGSHALQVGCSVENITDQLYREHLDFNNITRPGRSFLFNLSYSFH